MASRPFPFAEDQSADSAPELARLRAEAPVARAWAVQTASGVIYALTVELQHGTAEDALTRVQAIENTVTNLLTTAQRTGTTPAQAAHELTQLRLRAAAWRRR